METAEQTSQVETTLDQQQIKENAGNKSPGKRTIDQVEGEISELPESKKQNDDDDEVVNETESKDEYKITTPVTGLSGANDVNDDDEEVKLNEVKPVEEAVSAPIKEQSQTECGEPVEPVEESDQSGSTAEINECDTTVQVDYSNEESPELQSSNDGTVVDLTESVESSASTDSEKTATERSVLTQSSTCNPTIAEEITPDLKNDIRSEEVVC